MLQTRVDEVLKKPTGWHFRLFLTWCRDSVGNGIAFSVETLRLSPAFCANFKSQQMRWQRAMRKYTAKMIKIDVSRLRGWHPKDPSTSWWEIWRDLTVNRRQWISCCQLSLSPNDRMSVRLYSQTVFHLLCTTAFFGFPDLCFSLLL